MNGHGENTRCRSLGHECCVLNVKLLDADCLGAPVSPFWHALSALTLRRGCMAIYPVTIAPASGSNLTVGFQMSGASNGSTATFNPSSVTGSGSTSFSVIVPSGAKRNYTLTITGTNIFEPHILQRWD